MADPEMTTPNGDKPMTTAEFARAGQSSPGEAGLIAPQGQSTPALLPENEVIDLRKRWADIQTGFVDEPRRAVEDADALVAGAMQRLAEVFASERAELERRWDRGDNVSTEDLRVALQQYRAFFGRLLSI